jgi:hypothetical protein
MQIVKPLSVLLLLLPSQALYSPQNFFPNALNARFSLNATDLVPHPYKIGRIAVLYI